MKNKTPISALSVFAALAVLFTLGACGSKGKSCVDGEKKQIYEWRIYTLKGDNARALDNFFSDVLIPAYDRMDVTVGAFEPQELQEGEAGSRYLLLVYSDICHYMKAKHDIWNDETFRKAAQPFYDLSAPAPGVYSNFESILCEAFDLMPVMRRPDAGRGLFEYRIYQSRNEEANQRKIGMFHAGEIDIFDSVGINSVCYGEVLAGGRMPSLVYLTWYKDMDSRNEAWKRFNTNELWKQLRTDPQYANTATNNSRRMLLPMAYSQI